MTFLCFSSPQNIVAVAAGFCDGLKYVVLRDTSVELRISLCVHACGSHTAIIY